MDTRPVRRGAQVFVHELKNHFFESGFEVKRIFLYQEHQYECLQLSDTDTVLHFSENSKLEKWLFFQPELYKELSIQIQLFNPDVILCNGSRTLKYAALVKRFSKDLKAKWIYRVIDSARYWNSKFLITFIYRVFIIPAMDAAIGVSKQSLREMVSHYRFNKPVISIPRAVNIDYFVSFHAPHALRSALTIDEKAFVLLFLGNFTQQKRPDKFIQIIAHVKKKHPHIHGLMVGDGPLKIQMENLCEQLNVKEHITFAGYQQDVRPYISISNILMLTSDTEGMPGVMLEAAVMKKMTITADVGGVKEFIINGQNGIVLENNDINTFVAKLDQLMSSPSEIQKISESAYLNVTKHYSLKTKAEQYKDFFLQLLQSKDRIDLYEN